MSDSGEFFCWTFFTFSKKWPFLWTFSITQNQKWVIGKLHKNGNFSLNVQKCIAKKIIQSQICIFLGSKQNYTIWNSSFWEITFLVRKKSVIWDFLNKKLYFSKMDSPNMCQDNVFPAMHSCTYCENLPFFVDLISFWISESFH